MNIQKYQFDDQQISIVDQNGEPWFVATEVCAILGLSNVSVAIAGLDDSERSKLNLGRQGEANIINESGLYFLIMRSRKPEAKRFQRWVTSEVLPQIRKTGSYSIESLSRVEILRLALDSEEKRIVAEQRLAIAAPKVEHYDRFMGCVNEMSWDSVAKTLGLGRNLMLAALRNMKVLRYNNVPYQEHLEAKRFITKQRTHDSSDGEVMYPQTFVTPKGVKYLAERIEEIKDAIQEVWARKVS